MQIHMWLNEFKEVDPKKNHSKSIFDVVQEEPGEICDVRITR